MRIIKKFFSKDVFYFYRMSYLKFIKKIKLEEKNVLIESQQGRTIDGNMFYIMKELACNEKYKEYKIYVSLKNNVIGRAKKILIKNEINNVIIVPFLSKEYYKVLAQSKYLLTDTSFYPFFFFF